MIKKILTVKPNQLAYFIFGITLLFIGSFWVIDSIFDYFVFGIGESFLNAFILKLSPHEWYIRSLFIFACLLAGGLVLKYMRQYQASEERFRSLVESTSDWIWETDNKGCFTYCSPTVKKLLGYEPEELVGKTAFDLMLPNEAKQMSSLFKEILENRQPLIAIENTKIRKDGKYIVTQVSGMPFFEANGEFQGYRGIAREITERKKIERKLQEKENKFRHLIENINDWFWEIDANHIFTYSSPLSRELLGYEPDELIGKSLLNLIPKDEVQNIAEILTYSAEALEPFIGMESIIYHQDSHEMVIDMNGAPILDGQGHFCGYRGIGRDITERKLVEDEFFKAKRTLQLRNKFSHAIVHSNAEKLLLSEICQFMVEIAGYCLAWVGLINEEKNLKPVSYFGEEEEYLALMNATWVSTDTGEEPITMAIRTGQPVVHNIQDNFNFESWQGPALVRGYVSTITLPLNANNKSLGILNLYSKESAIFDTNEIRLLQSLSEDLAYGISALRDAVERKQAEETLRKNERFLQTMFDAIQDGIRVLDRNLNVLRVNNWMENMSIFENPLIGHKCYKNETFPCAWCPALKSLETGQTYSEIFPYPSAENPTNWHEITTFPLKDDEDFVTGIIEYVKDITERKQTEILLTEYNRKLEREVEERTEFIVENNALMYATLEATTDGILVVSNDKVLLYNAKFVELFTTSPTPPYQGG